MTGPRRWVADLAFGARLARSGGWTRTALTAVGVGLGVALLLGAASVPHMLQGRDDRMAARDDLPIQTGTVARTDKTLLVAETDTEYQGTPVVGRLVRPEGPGAPVPPGLSTLPGPGQLVVSPALARLLDSRTGALLRPRLPGRIVGLIGDPGLAGPAELMYYAGSAQLTLTGASQTHRIDHFGDAYQRDGLDPVLLLLVVVLLVVLLLPVAIFIGTAVRFGGEQRDRRLAALRLVGADASMARRIATGEALFGAVFGLLLGAVFFLAGRQLVSRVTLRNLSIFPSDVRPSPALTVLIVAAVPVVAIAVSLLALRHTVIEPLGVVRQALRGRRRLWWRLLAPLAGLALLLPSLGRVSRTGPPVNQTSLAVGTVLLLVGICALLPWLTETAVRRVSGGTVSWQLAIRRLQLRGDTSARVVSGVAVAVAGGIALQMLFAGVTPGFNTRTGQDPSQVQVEVNFTAVDGTRLAPAAAKLRATPGVRGVFPLLQQTVNYAGAASTLVVADCATLDQLITLDQCADGDSFTVADQEHGLLDTDLPAAGTRVTLGDPDPAGGTASLPQWTVPAGILPAQARRGPGGASIAGLVATPGAIDQRLLGQPAAQAYLALDAGTPDALERVRNTVAGVDPLSTVIALAATSQVNAFSNLRRGVFIGVVAVLLLIGASLLVGMLEQLRERRRLLAALVAFGTRRSTLSASVLWQSAVPVLLGLVLATVVGAGLGAVLLAMVRQPVRLDWSGIGAISGVAAAVVLLVTALSLPLLWRLMRPDGLRAE